jgi:hypothetical protein
MKKYTQSDFFSGENTFNVVSTGILKIQKDQVLLSNLDYIFLHKIKFDSQK